LAEYKVHFLPGKKSAYFEEGINFRDAALELGLIIESTCAGIGTCAKCKVIIQEGASAPTKVEELLLTPKQISKGMRLSCQALLRGDSVCTIPQESQLFKDQIITEGAKGIYPLDPDIRKLFLQLPPPKLGEKYFDFERLKASLQEMCGEEIHYDFNLTRRVANLLRDNDFEVTAIVDQNKLLSVEPHDTRRLLYGVALDIGTTSVAAKLLNITTGETVAVASALNPQRTYGADVISRINYVVEHKGGLELQHRIVVKEINALISKLCADAEIQPENIYKITAAGNTVMQHFLLNIDPRNLAYSPYTPVLQGPATIPAREIGIEINESGVLYTIPNLACFVGSDMTAVLTVLNLEENEDIQLVVDIGTNGEIVLGSRNKLLCTSSPAGPAWEGAYIAWGMRAARGAIERAEIVDGDLQFRTIGDADPIGICGSGLLDMVCEFRRKNMIDKTGRILSAQETNSDMDNRLKSRIISQENGANDIAIFQIDEDKHIMLMQKDIREVQLAKSTIAAGIKILMKELQVKAKDIANVYIAGAFGNHVRGKDAVEVGLIPKVPEDRIRFIGNAALSGAEAILLSKQARQKAEHIAKVIDYVEISDRSDFQEHFVGSMHFPED
jgi:uncharacterized 2Fe-2S/4Fe-4S cluster protein (DUF4445 family)